jgi:hypothetical protein
VRGKEDTDMMGVRLSRLPVSGKIFCTLYLVGIGCGAVAAFVQAATAVGLTPADVQASFGHDTPMTSLGAASGHGQHQSAEKEISIGDISSAAKVWVRTPLLIQTSHTHLFGQTLIAGLLGLIFLFSSLGERLKSLILALPFVGTLIDIGGMWLTRFVWPPLSVLVIAGGTLFAIGFTLIALISLYELWLEKERPA